MKKSKKTEPNAESGAVESGSEAPSAETIDAKELQRRTIFSLLGAAIALAKRFRVSLRDLRDWQQLAYFRALRAEGITLQEAAEWLEVSMRKSAELSQRLKHNFFLPEQTQELPRRIEFMLWAEPLGRLRIHQLIRDETPEAIDAALDRLVAEQRVEEIEDRPGFFQVTSSQARLVKDAWMAQIDGVNHFVQSLAASAYQRVFLRSPQALLRTLEFRVLPEDVESLHRFYEEVLFPRLAVLEKKARDSGKPMETMRLSICWSINEEDTP